MKYLFAILLLTTCTAPQLAPYAHPLPTPWPDPTETPIPDWLDPTQT